MVFIGVLNDAFAILTSAIEEKVAPKESYRLSNHLQIEKKTKPTASTFPRSDESGFNPLRPKSDLSQTSPYNIKGLSVSEVIRIENMISQVKFY